MEDKHLRFLLSDKVFKFEIIAWDFFIFCLSPFSVNSSKWGCGEIYIPWLMGLFYLLTLENLSFPNGNVIKARENNIWVIKVTNF